MDGHQGLDDLRMQECGTKERDSLYDGSQAFRDPTSYVLYRSWDDTTDKTVEDVIPLVAARRKLVAERKGFVAKGWQSR